MSEQKNSRILGFDVARALAIIGMVIVNFDVALTSYEVQSAAWARTFIDLFQGRAAALFVVLAGVGVSLMTRKAREANDDEALAAKRRSLLKRVLILFVLGLSWMPIWAADILHFYALYFLMAILLLKASDRQLLLAAAGLILLFVALFLIFDYEMGWDWETLNNLLIWTPAGFLRDLFFNGFHPVVPWAAFMLIGMWFGRQDVQDAAFRRWVLRWALGLALVTELLAAFLVRFMTRPELGLDAETSAFLFGSGPMPPLPFYMLAGSATALVVIVLCIGAAQRWADTRWLKALVATGQLALTLYLGHVLIGMGIMEGLGLIESQTAQFSLSYAALFSILALLFATWWRGRYARGPLEAVMRRLSS